MVVKNQKHVFWQALLVAMLIFFFGMLIGALVENFRTQRVDYLYLDSQVDLMDLRLQSDLFSDFNLDCELAVKKNVEFADRIYWEARTLEDYDSSSKISDELKIAHKRYDILRTMLWVNSIKIKENCDDSFHTVVYLYDYEDTPIQTKSFQNVFSKIALDLKEKRGNEILLIPIATDLQVDSLDLLMAKYNISEVPCLLIDEKYQITELMSVEEVENLLK
ncbi:MAG: hypothetical protein ABIH72_05650 [archaeon]